MSRSGVRRGLLRQYDANRLKSRGVEMSSLHACCWPSRLKRGNVDPALEVGGEQQAPPRLLGRLPPASPRLAGEPEHGAGKDAAPAAAWGSRELRGLRGLRGPPAAGLPAAAERPPRGLQRHQCPRSGGNLMGGGDKGREKNSVVVRGEGVRRSQKQEAQVD